MTRRAVEAIGTGKRSETVPLSRPYLQTDKVDGPLPKGTLLSDRFWVEAWVGRGGMGDVYRGRDLTTQAAVAIKVIARFEPDDAERFAREAALLATLSHPGIVRYVAHGTAPSGNPFLVMNWLCGRDLAARLAEATLTAMDTWRLMRRVCEALQHAHSRGIVHRDLKPSNLILVDDDPANATVLDFGVAHSRDTRQLTRAGMVLGTVGYMAPEQALGELDLDARADVFSLGCLLYECLTGQPAFGGRHTVAVLSRLWSGEAPRLAQLNPHLAAFDPLLGRLLARDRSQRPRDAAEVLTALLALEPALAEVGETRVISHGAVSDRERKLATVVLCSTGLGAGSDIAALARVEAHVRGTLGLEAEIRRLSEHVLLVAPCPRSAGSASALHAAQLACAILQLEPGLCAVLASGFVELGPQLELTELASDALRLLRSARHAAQSCVADALSADLIRPQFELEPFGPYSRVREQRAGATVVKPVLGKCTPCVGREKELALLEATWLECKSDRVVRSVLVTAGQGMGKSRLAHELIARARTHGGARVLWARGDALGSASTLSLVRQLILSGLGLGPEASRLQRQVRAVACFAQCGLYRARSPHAAFLAELIDAPLRRTHDPLLRAAHADPALMSEQKRRAFSAFIAALCARSPIMIVIDDLHWADLASVDYLEEALRESGDCAIMLCGLARPEVHDQFPHLWHYHERQELRLPRLTARASERLVRAILGDDTPPATVTRIVRSADGNAFHIEELLRHLASGSEEPPQSLVALAQAQLEPLPAAARHVLRAASVFGERCWSSGVQALVGTSVDAGVELEHLVRQELLVRASESRIAGQAEYRPRHPLLRAAAYAMLTVADRAAAHCSAAQWLGDHGEPEAALTHQRAAAGQ